MDAPTSASGENGSCWHSEVSELSKMKPASDLGTFIPSLIFGTMGNADSEVAKFQPCTKPQLKETQRVLKKNKKDKEVMSPRLIIPYLLY